MAKGRIAEKLVSDQKSEEIKEQASGAFVESPAGRKETVQRA